MAKKIGFKVGQYYAAKYSGKNGDLIVGEVKSVRKKGDVILINLLNGKRSVKRADILRSRNKRISKAQADELVALYSSTKDKDAVRTLAVSMRDFDNGQTEMPLPPPTRTPREEKLAYIEAKKTHLQALLSAFMDEIIAIMEEE